MNDLDLDDIFVSNQFNIATQEILLLKEKTLEWIGNGIPGAIIYGRPRIGKTRAILYISAKLKEKYGRELPVFIYNATNHVPKDKYLYSELLKVVGHIDSEKGTVTALKERLMNSLASYACNTKYRKIVLFIDEAYHLADKDFQWLMDIYNNLNLKNIHMSIFLIGTEELKAKKQALILSRQHQIVGRFMVEESRFHGIKSIKDMSICLYNFDVPYTLENNEKIIFTKYYFPRAYEDGKRLTKCADLLMQIFEKNMKEIGIPATSEIPMMYFITTLKYCFRHYGVHGKNLYFPDEEAWDDSIKHSGYLAAERVYYDI